MKSPSPLSPSSVAKMLAAGSCTLALLLAPARAADKEAALSEAEQQYLQAVAKENLGEIAISYLALEKSASDDLKSEAKTIIDNHTKSMQELMALASKHNCLLSLEPDLSSYQTLLPHGGGDFDKVYAAEMQRLNQQAIDKLNGVMQQLTASDVKNFAEDDLKDDKSHLKSAQDLAAKLK